MKTRTVKLFGLGLALISSMFLLSNPTLARPLSPTVDQPLTVAAPAAVTRTFNLCATTGSVTMPDSTSVPIWGFGEISGTSGGCAAQLPGPVLEANVGDTVVINVYNYLPPGNNLSLVFPGQNIMPDNVGVAPNDTATYSFVVTEPGTYLYESGTDYIRQVPMGLYGTLVVHPATAGQAYGSTTSAYDSEQVLVLSELDPNLNNDPAGFNMLNYAPLYWLINGKAYDQTDNIVAAAGQKVLLRYVNAGLTNHTMTMLGMHQDIVARDAFELPAPVEIVAETIPSGQTLDTIATIPAGAAVGDTFPVYNRQLHITNGPTFPGGMMTFIEVGTSALGGLNFNDYTLTSFGTNQDANPTVNILDGGATLSIVGNGWKKIDFPYTVTPYTVLEFDFYSGAEGEIHGIGLDEDNLEQNTVRTFQLYGTQTFGIQAFNDYAGETPSKHYIIPVGQFYTGNMQYLTFTNDHDVANPTAESVFSNIQVYEAPPPPPPMLTVNGNSYPIESYGTNQDANPLVSIEDGGLTLRIVGNGWKKISLPYSVTPNTVLDFDFQSSAEGEIHGIGLDEDNLEQNTVRTFQLYGTQTFGIQVFNNYAGGGVQHYSIPVGQFYTGNMLYLTFTNDHDVPNPTAESVFSNISVHE